ncbi:immunoglobulin domain-containing protein oig-4-like [Styela clava]
MYAVLSFSDTIPTYNSRTSFWNAKKACENKGMRLAHVEIEKEFEILQSKLPSKSNEKYWIGTKHEKCVGMSRDHLEFTECTSTSLPYICEVVSPYSVEVSNESPKIHENDDLQIGCTAKGFPLPDVFWYKDGERITEQTNQNVHQSIGSASATLKIDRAQMGDAGQYRCYATNTAIDFELRVFGFLYMEVYPEGSEIPQEKEKPKFW